MAKVESEVFLLGIWRDYEDLENSLSMPELNATLAAKRDQEYQAQKFNAALQGVDLDKQSGRSAQQSFKDFADKVREKHRADTPVVNDNDMANLRGAAAQKAGFGIGFGLDYETSD